MKRTTISLPEELATAVQREARRLGVGVSEVARRALAEHLHLDGANRLPFVGIGDSGQSHTARDFEQLLAQEWRPDRDR